MKVYVAGSSNDLDRVNLWRAQLVEHRITVTSTWPDVVFKVGEGNPRDASTGQRMEWSYADLAEVDAADVLWLLVPPPKLVAIHGSSVELGYAFARGKRLVASGDSRSSIFGGLAHEFEQHRDAFLKILEWAVES